MFSLDKSAMSSKVQLSCIPIDPDAIKKVLDQYAAQSHEGIIADFETALSKFTKARHVVALSSGTAAIHLALKAVGVMPDDEVLVSTFTYVATVNPILYLGARPVFIEVEAQSWNIDPAVLEIAINERLKKGTKPKAILVVHTYGMPAMMKEIMDISQRYMIPVVEDAAEALGSKVGDQYVGTFGKIGILSFNNNKILTTYGGGAVLTDDANMAQKISFWAGQSRETKMYYEHKEVGYNYRIGPINAAVGLSKMDRLVNEISERRKVFDMYCLLLVEFGLKFQLEKPGMFSNRWLSAFSVDNLDVVAIANFLEKQCIETRRTWNPMHRQPVFSAYKYFRGEGAVSEDLFAKSLCLPFSFEQTTLVVEKVSESIGYMR